MRPVAAWVSERGQASVELLAGIPFLAAAGLAGLQLLAVGYSSSLADGAVEAGALAVARGAPAGEAVREALPGWAEDSVGIVEDGGRVTVTLEPPSPFEAVSRRLEVSSSAWVRGPE